MFETQRYMLSKMKYLKRRLFKNKIDTYWIRKCKIASPTWTDEQMKFYAPFLPWTIYPFQGVVFFFISHAAQVSTIPLKSAKSVFTTLKKLMFSLTHECRFDARNVIMWTSNIPRVPLEFFRLYRIISRLRSSPCVNDISPTVVLW